MLPVKKHWLYFVMSILIIVGLIMSTTNSVLAHKASSREQVRWRMTFS